MLVYYVRLSKDSGLLARWNRMRDVCFHNCMKGGRRPKKSRFRCTHDYLSSMAIECDGKHVHSPCLTYRSGGEWRPLKKPNTRPSFVRKWLICLRLRRDCPRRSSLLQGPALLGLNKGEAAGS